MTCKETQEFLSAHLDRQLAPADLREVRLHLDTCAACRAEEKSLLTLKETLRTLSMPAIPIELVAAIENETIFKPRWWETDLFRQRWAPVLLGAAMGLGTWIFLQRDQNPRQAAHPAVLAAAPSVSTSPVVAMHRDQEPEISEQIH